MTLREKIIAAMRENEAKARKEWGDRFHPRYAEYCTWWFRGRAGIPVAEARAELKRMERDGLVKANRSQTNNTKWLLVASKGGDAS